MEDRLSLVTFKDTAELEQKVSAELGNLARRGVEFWSREHTALVACCEHLAKGGAKTAVIQRRMQDPDFLAEFNAYYSRKFAHIARHCVRLHFFSEPATGTQDPLDYLDRPEARASYLGFITLRPVVHTPVGASILKPAPHGTFIRCTEEFPVFLGGVQLQVLGTPFMQQDNAVGACAQAAVWMALRTMRKREGDRAHDPAQITGAATRYHISGRILPNRSGLTAPQIMEAIRAAGYSPHLIPFTQHIPDSGVSLTPGQLADASRVLHAYVESAIPVLLILYTKDGGHAVVVIGHTFTETRVSNNSLSLSLARGLAVKMHLAAGWVPQFVIHNDNSGPYLPLANDSGRGYALDQTYAAVPLLPPDVFVSGEEALEYGRAFWEDTLYEIAQPLDDAQTTALSEQFVVRLLLLEKRKIRKWAVATDAPAEVRQELRMSDLPRRVWVLEFHLKDHYGRHATEDASSMVGFLLIDSTADSHPEAVFMAYLNLPAFSANTHGSLITLAGNRVLKTPHTPPIKPFRDLDCPACV